MSLATVPTPPRRDALAEPAEVATYLRVSVKTLAQWRWRRIGPVSTRAGGRVRYRWEDIDAWLAAQ